MLRSRCLLCISGDERYGKESRTDKDITVHDRKE